MKFISYWKKWSLIKKGISVIVCMSLIAGMFVGYQYVSYRYRCGTEPETTLTETNTDSILSDNQLVSNLKNYEVFDTLDVAEIDKISYVIPGLKATKTLESDSSGKFSMCTSMTPQGICVTEKYVFISAYCHTHTHNSVLYMLDKNTHEFIKEIVLPGKPHAGNIAYDDIHNNIWVACTGTNFITDQKTAYINNVSLDKIESYDFNTEKKPIKYDHKYMIDGFKNASFISYYRGNIFAGNYYEGEWKNSYIVRFPITEDGGLESEELITGQNLAYGKEKAVIGEYCQGVYFDQGYCIIMQSSGTDTSTVQSFVNSEYQNDVEKMIDLEQKYTLYKQEEAEIEQAQQDIDDKQDELDELLESIDDLKDELSQKVNELNQVKKEIKTKRKNNEDVSQLKDQKQQLEEEILDHADQIETMREQKESIRSELERMEQNKKKLQDEEVEFNEDDYNTLIGETKTYSLENKNASRSFEFPARLEQAMISSIGDYHMYLLFESAAYAYRAQMGVDVVDRVIMFG